MSDDRIGAILDAAYTCFTRHGVRRTTMDDLAREAGLSRPAVYQYVRNKEDAFRRLVQHLLDNALAASREAVAARSDLVEQLAGALESKLALVGKIWRDSPAHAAELLSVDARLSADLLAAYDAAMTELLAGALGGRSHDEAQEIANILMALTRGLEADLTDPAAPARRLRQGVTLIVAGLDTPDHTRDDS
ncbi:TetR/AcrR family transcriptional regulator [Streptomyces sp. NBC_00687]|uniref:TetR/AcrR family transcriptional regulator n=1 Tax=Streptomyces sp. NBC_00687 TaxID=2975807 RepID=UPI00225AA990|nr:TetR/AcrR family transcriptional regulator [Streptomyces sp. NBC_00687]MCX4918918.1 TetR/AcrR family transcriptional regulator [Streptomyces sp. NBC_00687]